MGRIKQFSEDDEQASYSDLKKACALSLEYLPNTFYWNFTGKAFLNTVCVVFATRQRRSEHSSVLSLAFAFPPMAPIIGKRSGFGRPVSIRTGKRHFFGFSRKLLHGNIACTISNRMLVTSTWLHASVIWGLEVGDVQNRFWSDPRALRGNFRVAWRNNFTVWGLSSKLLLYLLSTEGLRL